MSDLDALRNLAGSPTLSDRQSRRTRVGARSAEATKPTLLVCLEGPIGVGKSTVLAEIEKMQLPFVKVLYERVEDWKAVMMQGGDGKPSNMLACMYDGALSSAVFQMAILQSRFGTLVKALCDKEVRVVISERGPWSEKLVFAASNLADNEFAAYTYTQEAMLHELFPLAGPVAVSFLYLKLELDEAMARIATRGRAEEKSITREYMQKLDDAHQRMELTLKKEGLGVPNLVGTTKHVHVNASRTPIQVAEAIVESVEKLLASDAFQDKFIKHITKLDSDEGHESTLPLDVAMMAALPTAKSAVTAASLSKYEGALTRTDSTADHIEAEKLRSEIATLELDNKRLAEATRQRLLDTERLAEDTERLAEDTRQAYRRGNFYSSQ
jgi:deoxyadenosine/deoxycytidine kinase